MGIKGISWLGVLASSLLYGLLFIAVRFPLPVNYTGQPHPGLLLFLLPGALVALASKENPLSALIIAVALASPPCLALMQLKVFHSVGLGQEIALIVSAVFWCGSGTLAVMLWRTLLDIHQQTANAAGKESGSRLDR